MQSRTRRQIHDKFTAASPDELFTTKEVAILTNKSINVIARNRLVLNKGIPFHKKSNIALYTKKDIQEWLDKQP